MTGGRRRGRGRGAQGQATVELALALPVLALALLLVVQVALVARDQLLTVHAAREAARVAAVDPRPTAAPEAAGRTPGLVPGRLRVSVGPRGAPGEAVRVEVRYRARTDVPLVGALLGDPELRATVIMRIEGDHAGSSGGGT